MEPAFMSSTIVEPVDDSTEDYPPEGGAAETEATATAVDTVESVNGASDAEGAGGE